MVYQIQKITVDYLKSKLPNLQHVKYFTDGCAAEYKNKKMFYSLCMHYDDFGIHAAWSFFATSHGKSPCDGIGGTVKRLTAMESLRRPLNNQILFVEAMITHCSTNLPSNKFVNLLKQDLDELKPKLEKRWKLASTIKGPRSFHHFKPLSKYQLRIETN